ncbi:hypothetical protein BGZ74_005619, partial [Mortierella antarctica]
ALSSTPLVKGLMEELEVEEADDLDTWKAMDLYLSLVPKALIKKWKELFYTSCAIATYMAGKFVAALEEFGRTELWGARCMATVEWEKSVGITAVSKRARGRTGVGDHLSSGSDFSDLNSRPRSASNNLEPMKLADDRVMQQYQGRLCLD